MALKEYIGLARLTQAFSLLKSKLDGKEDTPTVISYDDFMALTPQQQTSGYYLVVGGTTQMANAAGHAIQNESGTDLTQRDTLQFKGGLKATDDATNKKTVVDGSPTEITWAEYNAMAPEQQQALEHTLVTDVPGADGTISADLMTKLWENPSPTSEFLGQTVTLDLSDYDAVIVIAGYDNTSSHSNINCFTAFVGSSGTISMTNYAASARQRNFDVATTGIGFTATYLNGSASNTDNTACIPLAIYGIKKTITVKFDALARDVSTSASKCMLSDGETSVEDAVKAYKPTLRAQSTAGGTRASQLAELQSAYNALSELEKQNSYIVVNDTDVYRCDSITDGRFSILVESDANLYYACFIISTATSLGGTYNSIKDNSTGVASWNMKLYA